MAGWSKYGWYRYGRSEFRPEKSKGEARFEDRGPSPEELFGAGVALRSVDDGDGVSWDFIADESGDLGATKGFDELGKDVAFRTAREGTGLTGTLGSANDQSRMESGIEQVMVDDTRVNQIDADISRVSPASGRFSVGIDVVADTERLPRFVFPLEL